MTVKLKPPEEFPSDGDSAKSWGKWFAYLVIAIVAALTAWQAGSSIQEGARALLAKGGGSLNLKNGVPGVGS